MQAHRALIALILDAVPREHFEILRVKQRRDDFLNRIVTQRSCVLSQDICTIHHYYSLVHLEFAVNPRRRTTQ